MAMKSKPPDPNKAARLKEARKRDYPSAAAAAKAIGIPYPTYYAHEHGDRGFKHEAERYARFFKVNLEWLWSNRGPMERARAFQDEIDELPDDLREDAVRYARYLKSEAAKRPS
jgi:DNA-binding XRE family transcriptional regulator